MESHWEQKGPFWKKSSKCVFWSYTNQIKKILKSTYPFGPPIPQQIIYKRNSKITLHITFISIGYNPISDNKCQKITTIIIHLAY